MASFGDTLLAREPKQKVLPAKQSGLREWAKQYGVDRPTDPRHEYDFEAAFKAGVVPIQWKDLPKEQRDEDIAQGRNIPPEGYMWPDRFKLEGHAFPAKPSPTFGEALLAREPAGNFGEQLLAREPLIDITGMEEEPEPPFRPGVPAPTTRGIEERVGAFKAAPHIPWYEKVGEYLYKKGAPFTLAHLTPAEREEKKYQLLYGRLSPARTAERIASAATFGLGRGAVRRVWPAYQEWLKETRSLEQEYAGEVPAGWRRQAYRFGRETVPDIVGYLLLFDIIGAVAPPGTAPLLPEGTSVVAEAAKNIGRVGAIWATIRAGEAWGEEKSPTEIIKEAGEGFVWGTAIAMAFPIFFRVLSDTIASTKYKDMGALLRGAAEDQPAAVRKLGRLMQQRAMTGRHWKAMGKEQKGWIKYMRDTGEYPDDMIAKLRAKAGAAKPPSAVRPTLPARIPPRPAPPPAVRPAVPPVAVAPPAPVAPPVVPAAPPVAPTPRSVAPEPRAAEIGPPVPPTAPTPSEAPAVAPAKVPVKQPWEMTGAEFESQHIFRGVGDENAGLKNTFWGTLGKAQAFARARGIKNPRIRVARKSDIPKDILFIGDAVATPDEILNRFGEIGSSIIEIPQAFEVPAEGVDDPHGFLSRAALAAKPPPAPKPTPKVPVKPAPTAREAEPGKVFVPDTKAAKAAAKNIIAAGKKVAKGVGIIVEPAKAVEIKHGKATYATVIRAIHRPEAAGLDFDQHQLETLDKSIEETGKMFAKYPDAVLHNLMATRGHNLKGEARKIQVRAFATLPKELKTSSVRRAIDEIADFNYRLLQKITGLDKGYLFADIHKLDDYFYGIYKNPTKVAAFLDYWRTTDRFKHKKQIPTYADALAYGLELRDPNPVHNLRAEYIHIARLGATEWLRAELMLTGEGKFIAKSADAPPEWDVIGERLRPEPVFEGLKVEPDLARLINNLLSTNKITQIPVLNFMRKVNNLVRTVKFMGSAFHLLSVAKQSFADTGYLGFLKVWKPQTWRGISTGFRKNDPIFKTPEYKDYIEHGGGHRYSIESEAQRAFAQSMDKLTKNSRLMVRGLSTPIRLPVGFTNWMFKSYIPKIKYAKYLDTVATLQNRLGRPLTSAEKIDIIKEQQNFYGMMNERTFGRSGTVTTAMRFNWISPSYAEGNARTIIKGSTQWGVKETYNASRSRSNVLNSFLITTILATVGTLIMTGKWPKKPEDIEDMRDLFKIDTGKTDKRNQRIMIDLMTYDKDYWNVYFNVLRGRPDIAVDKSIKRIGGMKAPAAELVHDMISLTMGKAIYDWKEDRIFEITDPFLRKVMKTVVHELRRAVPISVSVRQQAINRDMDAVTATVEALLGVRPGRTERDIKEFEIVRQLWSLRDQREKLAYRIGQYDDPFGAVETYNAAIQKIIDSKFVKNRAPELIKKARKLLIDHRKVIKWKRFPREKVAAYRKRISESRR